MKLLFSGKMKERQKFFPWLKIFLRKLLKNFPNDSGAEVLQYLLQNIEAEINAISPNNGRKRKEALFETINDLFLHFWWKIRWKNKRKWSKCWKKELFEKYPCDEHTQCCEKLLHYIIYLGILLSKGTSDSHWIGKILQAIKMLPSFDDIVYNALLLINSLKKQYHCAYAAILKHVLCTDVAEDLAEPVVYIKIIILFRRLKKLTEDKVDKAALISTASRIKPPSNTITWISSLNLGFTLKKKPNIAQKLLSKKCSNDIFKKLYQIVIETEHLAIRESSYVCREKAIGKTRCKVKIKKSKHNSKGEDPNKQHHTDTPTDVNDSVNSTASIRPAKRRKLSHLKNSKKSSGEHSPLNNKLPKQKERTKHSKSKKSEENSVYNISVNEFLNTSFAEISTFPKNNAFSQLNEHKTHYASKRIKTATKHNASLQETVPIDSIVTKKTSSKNNKKLSKQQSVSLNVTRKRIKLNHNANNYDEAQQSQGIQSKSIETLSSDTKLMETPNVNSVAILDANCENASQDTQIIEERASFTEVAPSCDTLATNSSLSHHAQISIENIFNKDTDIIHDRPSSNNLLQSVCEKISYVALTDVKKLYPSVMSQAVDLSNSSESYVNTNVGTKSYPPLENTKIYETDTDSDQTWYDPPNYDRTTGGSSSSIRVSRNINGNSKTICEIDKRDTTLSGNQSRHDNQREAICCSLLNEDVVAAKQCSNSVPTSMWVSSQTALNSTSILQGPFGIDRWKESQFSVPITISENENLQLQLLKNHPVDNKVDSYASSKMVHKNQFVTYEKEKRFDNVSVTQNNNTSNCIVDCGIVRDYEQNNSNSGTSKNETIPFIKVIINVTCKNTDDKEHIFGNFESNTDTLNTNSTEKVFNNFLHPVQGVTFSVTNSGEEMPRLHSYYEDPSASIAAVGAIATPPESEHPTSIAGSPHEQENSLLSAVSDKAKYFSSTPKVAPSAFVGINSSEESEFRTPHTSDCESMPEWALENITLNTSPSLINPLSRSPVDNVLKRLNLALSEKDVLSPQQRLNTEHAPVFNTSNMDLNSAKGHSCDVFKNSSIRGDFRNSSDVYYSDISSDDASVSTISLLWAEENEGSGVETAESSPNTIPSQKNAKVGNLTNVRKKPIKRKLQSDHLKSNFEDRHRDSRSTITADYCEMSPNNVKDLELHASGYNLRSRKSITEPKKLCL